MRGSNHLGRFDIDFERGSILDGIGDELVRTIGQNLEWWRWDQATSQADSVYDVGSIATGRRWRNPIKVPCVAAVIFHGVTAQNERGFYNTDVLRVTINMEQVEPLLPDLPKTPDAFLKDRIVYRNQVFSPTRLYPRGILKDQYTLFTLDANQVNPEELVNDQQFSAYTS